MRKVGSVWCCSKAVPGAHRGSIRTVGSTLPRTSSTVRDDCRVAVVRASDRCEAVDLLTLEEALSLLGLAGGTLLCCEAGGWLLVIDDAADWPIQREESK